MNEFLITFSFIFLDGDQIFEVGPNGKLGEEKDNGNPEIGESFMINFCTYIIYLFKSDYFLS